MSVEIFSFIILIWFMLFEPNICEWCWFRDGQECQS